ncbi:MAG TPA: LPXTG cell wall anchor domain-containing protein [Verrucomicrobiae bacterium]|nr:LPXTG cell wall anchor domain-containing protein [Verrucomicrobiae bacterium]
MNTNVQTHTDFIWSFQFDKGAAAVTIGLALVALVVLVVLARKRKKP